MGFDKESVRAFFGHAYMCTLACVSAHIYDVGVSEGSILRPSYVASRTLQSQACLTWVILVRCIPEQ
jgi:hypothetical protein